MYILRSTPSDDQYMLRTREEAEAQAARFAERQHVRAWLTNGGDDFVLLERRDSRTDARVKATLTSRLRAEYREMPGMKLTIEQAALLCGIGKTLCKTTLNALVDEGFLYVRADGAYARLM